MTIFQPIEKGKLSKAQTLRTNQRNGTSDVMEIFHALALGPMEFRYLLGNCHNRAHMHALYLHAWGFTCGKIWAFAPRVYTNDDQTTIQVEDTYQITSDGAIHWGYHVAPVVYLQRGKQTLEIVMDHALFPQAPLTVSDWLRKLHTPGLKHVMTPWSDYLFYPSPFEEKNGGIVPEFYTYEGLPKYQGWLESGLALDKTAFQCIENEFLPLLATGRRDLLPMLSDFQFWVGNILHADILLREKLIPYNFEYDFWNRHASVIQKYQELYDRNLRMFQAEVQKWID